MTTMENQKNPLAVQWLWNESRDTIGASVTSAWSRVTSKKRRRQRLLNRRNHLTMVPFLSWHAYIEWFYWFYITFAYSADTRHEHYDFFFTLFVLYFSFFFLHFSGTNQSHQWTKAMAQTFFPPFSVFLLSRAIFETLCLGRCIASWLWLAMSKIKGLFEATTILHDEIHASV